MNHSLARTLSNLEDSFNKIYEQKNSLTFDELEYIERILVPMRGKIEELSFKKTVQIMSIVPVEVWIKLILSTSEIKDFIKFRLVNKFWCSIVSQTDSLDLPETFIVPKSSNFWTLFPGLTSLNICVKAHDNYRRMDYLKLTSLTSLNIFPPSSETQHDPFVTWDDQEDWPGFDKLTNLKSLSISGMIIEMSTLLHL